MPPRLDRSAVRDHEHGTVATELTVVRHLETAVLANLPPDVHRVRVAKRTAATPALLALRQEAVARSFDRAVFALPALPLSLQ